MTVALRRKHAHRKGVLKHPGFSTTIKCWGEWSVDERSVGLAAADLFDKKAFAPVLLENMTVYKIVVDAVLFDMDGTLIDSTPGVMNAWSTFAKDYGFDGDFVARSSHGRRLYDTLKEHCKIEDEEKLLSEIGRFEEEVLKGGPVALPGAIDLIKQIQSGDPWDETRNYSWAIATSGTMIYAPRALAVCGITVPSPAQLVTSEDVERGKPHPDPYLKAAERCGVSPESCLVIEDAPSGLNSGRSAGCKTLAVCTSHSKQSILAKTTPDYIVKDLTKVSFKWTNGKLEFTVDDSEQ